MMSVFFPSDKQMIMILTADDEELISKRRGIDEKNLENFGQMIGFSIPVGQRIEAEYS